MRAANTESAAFDEIREAAADLKNAGVAGTDAVVASLADFPELTTAPAAAASGSIDHLLDVTVRVTAELGRVTMSIADILKLCPGSVVGLDRSIVEMVDLLVQGVPFARGEVVVVDERFAIRIHEIIDPRQAAKK